MNKEELLKRAEMSLREAPYGFDSTIPIQVINGKIMHPNLTEDGDLRKEFSKKDKKDRKK